MFRKGGERRIKKQKKKTNETAEQKQGVLPYINIFLVLRKGG